MPGYSFPLNKRGELDRKLENPDPFTYNPDIPRRVNAKPFNSGPDDKDKEVKDNGIPGPGTYPAEDYDDKIRDPTVDNAAPKWSFGKITNVDIKTKDGAKSVPGPGTYTVIVPAHTSKHVAIGTQSKSGKGAANIDADNEITAKYLKARRRREEQNQHEYIVPGPEYDIQGDFDFPDPRKPEESKGKKKAKFCFGMNTKQRAKNLDMPGPGEYEVDQYPMN